MNDNDVDDDDDMNDFGAPDVDEPTVILNN